MYDFETLQDRRNIGAEKWAALDASGQAGPDIIPFSIADMEFMTAPPIVNALREKAELSVYGYTMADDEYLSAVCSWCKTRHRWTVLPNETVQTAGVVAAIGIAIRAFTEKGDGILIQPPVYAPFHRLPRSNERTLIENPLVLKNGRYEMDFEDLERKAALPNAKMMLLCSPHNPVGRVWTQEELLRVSEICNRHHILVFSDEIHFDLVYPPHVHTVYATLSDAARNQCIIGTAASKSFNLAGLATSNIIIQNQELRRKFRAQTYLEAGKLNNYFGLAATRAAYETGALWLDELLSYLSENQRHFARLLQRYFPRVTVFPLEGTYLLWADFQSFGLSPAQLEQFMIQDAALYLDEGAVFGAQGNGFERFNLACPRRYLTRAAERLDRAAEKRGLPR
ncbi:MAG: pyridoxal phosphate-dependent aminotransferase [Oscillospiraceae bacterium]|nr:pyridoxal phosphate-dependent aminotransferase [Oscillospiraceae bacterium]